VQKMKMEWCLRAVRRESSSDEYDAFELYGIKGIDAKEVAAKLNMTVGHVRVAKHRVTNKLRELRTLLDKQIERDMKDVMPQ